MKKFILLILLLLLFLPTEARASENNAITDENVFNTQVNSLDTKKIEEFIDELNRDTGEYIPPLDFKSLINAFKTGEVGYSFKGFITGIIKFFINDVLLNTKLLAELVILTIICAILQNLESSFSNDNLSSFAYYACYLVLIIIVIKSFTLAVDIGKKTISRMVDFMLALLPTILTLLASAGGFSSVSIFDPIILFGINFTSNVVRNFILPLIFVTAVLNLVNNLSTTFQLNKLAGLLKQVCLWTLGLILTIFVGVLTIRSGAGNTLDQVTAKSLKFAIDNFIPVVGKCLSDAVSTIAGYTLLLKDAVSTVGLIAFVIICIFPLIKIISMIFIYKVASALIEPISDKKIVNCLNDVGTSLTLIFVSVLCVAILFFIMVSIIAATGKAAIMSG